MIAYYLRLSGADEENSRFHRESDSIESQRLTLLSYQKNHLDIGTESGPDPSQHLEYIDDGFTGRNFKRPGWNRLIEDCKKGKVDTLLVRDASRLGRNHIEVENYLQMVFPALNVRVICVQEHYDSRKAIFTEEISFQNIINDWYSRDIGMKVRSSLSQRWKNGDRINRKAPYGYVCHDKEKGYEVDPEAAVIVKRIFTAAAEGKTATRIADDLNRDGVPTPLSHILKRDGRTSAYGSRMETTRIWMGETICRILKNETYTGVRIAHTMAHRRDGKAIRVPDEEQFRYEDDHEPLVSRELFEKAQGAIRSRGERRSANNCGNPAAASSDPRQGLFKRLLRCGNCHRRMVFSGTSYRCGRAIMAEYTGCSRERVSEDFLTMQVQAALLKKAEQANRILNGQEDIPVADGIEEEIQRLKKRQMDSFEEMSNGNLSLDAFIQIRDDVRQKVEKLQRMRSEIAGKTGYRIDLEYALKPLAKLNSQTELTQELLESLVEAVYVSEGSVEVVTRAEQYLDSGNMET